MRECREVIWEIRLSFTIAVVEELKPAFKKEDSKINATL